MSVKKNLMFDVPKRLNNATLNHGDATFASSFKLMEYDNVYPPLNSKHGDDKEGSKPQKTAMQQALDSMNDKRHIIIPIDERKHVLINEDFINELKSVCKRYGVIAKYTITSIGSLVLDIKSATPGKKIEENSRVMIRDAMSKPISRYMPLTLPQIRYFSEHRLVEKFSRSHNAKIMLDSHAQRVHILAGPASVKNIESDIEEYLLWNCEAVSCSVEIPHGFHPHIIGPNRSTLNRILENSGKYIKAEFPSDNQNMIKLTGIPRYLDNAKRALIQLYEKLRQDYTYVCFRMCNSNYEKLQQTTFFDTLKSRGIHVSVCIDSPLKCTLSFVGDKDSADFVTEQLSVFKRDNYEVYIDCPYWICLFFKVMQQSDGEFSKKINGATIEIHPKQQQLILLSVESCSEYAIKIVNKIIEDIKTNASYSYEIIEDRVYRFLTSNNNERLKEIENKYSVNTFIEADLNGIPEGFEDVRLPHRLCTVIGVEGAVKLAANSIKQTRDYIDSFVENIIFIPNYLHRYLIGPRGSTLKELIKNHGSNCSVLFGKTKESKDNCIVKGPSDQVALLAQALKMNFDKLAQIHYRILIEVPEKVQALLFNDSSNIITALDKFGKLDSCYIPSISSSDKTIELIGPKSVSQLCEKYIHNRISELSVCVTKQFAIPDKLHPSFGIFSQLIIKYLTELVHHSVTIQLPKEIVPGNMITITGIDKNLDNVINLLKKLMINNSTECFFDHHDYSSKYSKFISSIISNIASSDVKTFFAHFNGNESHSLLIIGPASSVSTVKKNIENEIKRLDNTIETSMTVKADYKKEFMKKNKNNRTLVQDLSATYGNAHITIGERDSASNTVNIKISGQSEDVPKLLKEINSRIALFDCRISKAVDFNIKDLCSILESTIGLLKNTMEEFDVTISISENYFSLKGSNQSNSTDICQVNVRGMPENVNRAVEHIREDWMIISETIDFSYNLQKKFVDRNSLYFRTLSNNLRVSFELGLNRSPPENIVVVNGCKINVRKAVEYINNFKDKNFEISVKIPKKYFTKLIGKKGETVKNFGIQNNVRMIIPQKDSDQDVIITGEREKCIMAVGKLNEMVREWDSIITESIEIDARIKFKLLGQNSDTLTTIGKKHKTKVWLLAADEAKPQIRTINISGLPNDVMSCKQELKNSVTSIMEEFNEQYMYQPPPRNECYSIDVNALLPQYVQQNKLSQKQRKKQSKVLSENPSLTDMSGVTL